MKIEIMGPGCPRCHNTAENVNKALEELGLSAEVIHITNIDEMIDRGIIQTPALVIEGKLVMQGRIPSVEQIKQLIQKGG